jgi:hypothetical protein
VPLTPFSEDIFHYITKKASWLFASELQLKRYALNEMDRFSGTKIFLIGPNSKDGISELTSDKGDIKIS